jgi:TolB protein
MPHVKALSGTVLLLLSACSSTEPPDDSPPGTQIVFQAGDGASADIYVVNADGSGLTRLTDYADADLAPSWSADGRQIYFLSQNHGGAGSSGLYAMNADGTGVHLVVNSVHGPYAVSPDGTSIAFGAPGPQGNLDLFLMNADGSQPTLILDVPCDLTYVQCMTIEALAWSPDGQRIAYSVFSRGHGLFEYGIIGTVNADGTGQEYLTTSDLRCTRPAWAPDGQRIAFSSTRTSTIPTPGAMALEVMNSDGTGRTAMLVGGTSPSWSADGQSIVFVESGGLFTVNADGTDVRHVTDAPGGAFASDWNPAGP